MKTKRSTTIILSILIALSLMPGYAFAEGESSNVNDQDLTEATEGAEAPEVTVLVQDITTNNAGEDASDVTKGDTSGTRDGAEIIDSGTCGENVTWTLDSEGLLTISGYGPIKDDNSEIGIYGLWGSKSESIVKVVIEEGITRIGRRSFSGCSNMTSITIPESVESIKDFAFSRCSSLTSITIPEGVTSIGVYAISHCSGLTSVTIPDSVTSIGDSAFHGCSSLTSITIPEGVTSIGNRVFYECSSLTSITIPEGVGSIESGAFYGCSSLTSITIPDGVTSIGDGAFNECSSLTSITIPDSVTSIGDSAFYGCSSLTSITIPEGVTSIGDSAFYGCSSLTSITIPDGVTSIGVIAFYGCSSLTSITIPKGVTSIASGTFDGCSSLTSITIPGSVKTIRSDVFYGCSNLKYVFYGGPIRNFNSVDLGNAIVHQYASDHNYGELKPEQEASCTECGIAAHYECSVCNALFIRNGDEYVEKTKNDLSFGTALGHDYETIVTAPTCTEEGYTTHTCSRCKDSYVDSNVDAFGHDWADPEWTWSGDHSSASAKFTCKNDGTHVESIDAEVTIAADDTGDNIVYTAKATLDGKEYTETITAEKRKRIYGISRYDTAIKEADEYKAATGSKFENVVVAYGKNFPDALSGGYLAKVKNAPILLVEPKQEDRIADYISENIADGGTVYILGGTGAVSSEFESKVEAKGITPVRLGGATRYETNLEILKAAGVTNQYILVCTGTGYADSLSASAVGKPILLVGKTLTDEQKAYIGGLSSQKFYLIGGTGAVNTSVEKGLKNLGYNVDRISGASRYETSTEVAKKFFPSAKTVVLAYAKNFPDGLSGGPLAMKKNAPIILTDSNKTAAATEYVKETGAVSSITLGGSSLISDIAVTAIMGR